MTSRRGGRVPACLGDSPALAGYVRHPQTFSTFTLFDKAESVAAMPSAIELERLSRLGALLLLATTGCVNLAVLARGSSSQKRSDVPVLSAERADSALCQTQAARVPVDQSLAGANMWSGLICLIAAGFYIELNDQRIGLAPSTVRSMDWLITCPLLALEMSALLGVSVADRDAMTAAAASAAMVLIGWGDRVCAWRLLLGFIALGVVAVSLRSMARRRRASARRRGLVAFFFSLWVLYGVVAVLRSTGVLTGVLTGASFNTLDCGSKAVFGIAVAYLALLSAETNTPARLHALQPPAARRS